jgi:NADPH:quinone reductase-like Zn-dependent oxidoreductase
MSILQSTFHILYIPTGTTHMSLERFSLSGKTVLVTGASSGIGYGIAKGLADVDATVVPATRRVELLEQLRGHFRMI